MKHLIHEKEYEKIIEEHPILYRQSKASEIESAMSYGICCPSGWITIIRKLSDKLEAVNLIYGKKYGLAIEAEQVKEKYGTLRFYSGVTPIESSIGAFFAKPLIWLRMKIMRRRKVNFDKKYPFGRLVRILEYVAFNLRFAGLHTKRFRREQEIVMSAMNQISDDLITEAEKESSNVCCICGRTIGTGYRPRKQSSGWIRFYCEECYEKKTSTTSTTV